MTAANDGRPAHAPVEVTLTVKLADGTVMTTVWGPDQVLEMDATTRYHYAHNDPSLWIGTRHSFDVLARVNGDGETCRQTVARPPAAVTT